MQDLTESEYLALHFDEALDAVRTLGERMDAAMRNVLKAIGNRKVYFGDSVFNVVSDDVTLAYESAKLKANGWQ